MKPIGSGASPPALILGARALAPPPWLILSIFRRHCQERGDEAIHRAAYAALDCFAHRIALFAPSRWLAMTVDDNDMIRTRKSLNWFSHGPRELSMTPPRSIHAARVSAFDLHLGCRFDFRLGAVCSRFAATRRAATGAACAQATSSSGSSNSRSGTRQNERSIVEPCLA